MVREHASDTKAIVTAYGSCREQDMNFGCFAAQQLV